MPYSLQGFFCNIHWYIMHLLKTKLNEGWQYRKGLIYLSSIFRLTKLAFLRARALSVALVLGRLILFAEILASNKSFLCRITILAVSFVLILTSSDAWHQHLRLHHGFGKKKPIGFNYALSGPLHAKVFTTCISYSYSRLFSALNCCH